jgi:hypothetical protein
MEPLLLLVAVALFWRIQRLESALVRSGQLEVKKINALYRYAWARKTAKAVGIDVDAYTEAVERYNSAKPGGHSGSDLPR